MDPFNVSRNGIITSIKYCKKYYNAKKTWVVLREQIRKICHTESSLPKKLAIKNKEITEIKDIAVELNNVFINNVPNLAKQVPNSSNRFTCFLN